MLCKRTFKNQITLSKKLVEAVGSPDYFETTVKDNAIMLIPVKISPLHSHRLSQTRKKIAGLGLSEKDIDQAIAWARKQ